MTPEALGKHRDATPGKENSCLPLGLAPILNEMAYKEPITTEDGRSAARRSGMNDAMLFLLTAASAVVVANAYYIHPIIARVGEDFNVSDAMIGIVPALNQIALAIGIFLLLPLGDRFSNRRLVAIFVGAQTLSIALMAFSTGFLPFVIGSTVLGFFTITPYLLPAYVSKRVEPGALGRATAILTTGIIAGILIARMGSGAIGEYLGWRTVYFIAAGLMLAVTLLLPFVMEGRREVAPGPKHTYLKLIASMGPLVRTHPEILTSGAIQGLNFGIFLSIWMGLGLHLTSPVMGFGTDVVGYLAGLAVLNLFTTAPLGSWADRVGARRARFRLACVQFGGACLFLVTGHSLWLLIIPLTLTGISGPVIDVTNRMTFLSLPPDLRTRLMTIYIVFMFAGGGIASWAGTAAYAFAGWTGNALLAIAMSGLVLFLSLRSGQGDEVSRDQSKTTT